MKNKDNSIIKNNLSTLLKRFSNSDVINTIGEEYQSNSNLRLNPNLIDDNRYLKDATEIDEKTLAIIMKSIGEKSILNPLIVRPWQDRYEIISGRKRLEAAKRLKIATVPVIIHQFNDEDMLIYMLYILKAEREINIIEIASICKALSKKYFYTQQSLAMMLDISRPQVTNIMRILRLPKNVQKYIAKGKLSYGHAKALVTLQEKEIQEIVKKILSNNLSVRETELLVQQLKQPNQIKDYENKLSEQFQAKVKIHSKSVNITFENKEQLIEFLKNI